MSENQRYIVDLNRLELGKHIFEFRLDDAFLQTVESSELKQIDADVKAELVLREDDYELKIRTIGTVSVVCDRCLDLMPIAVDNEETIETEDVDRLDLKWLAYELIIVNLPLVHCHHEGQCNPEMANLLQQHLCSTTDDPEA